MKYSFLLVVFLFAFPVVGLAEDQICNELQAEKKRLYGFRPSTFTSEQKDRKSTELDRFWALVKTRGGGVDCLRAMILAEKTDGFFLFDASSLLASLDSSKASNPAISHGLLNTDLNEVDPAGYIRFVLWLSYRGVDAGPFALKYLTHPKVDTSVAEHGGMRLDRDGGAVLLYGSMPPSLADKYLIAALAAKEPYTRVTAAQVLALNMTEEGFKALKSWPGLASLPAPAGDVVQSFMKRAPVKVPARPKLSRTEVLAKISQVPPPIGWIDEELKQSAVATLTAADLDAVREARRKSITGVSDEALSRYFDLTRIMLGVINRLDLYKEHRIH